MVKNRYFKNTLGHFAELIIAAALDTEETSGTGAVASSIAVTATLAANGTAADTITFTVDGVPYTYTVSGTPTAAVMHDAITAMLSANTQGFVVSVNSGTTSSSWTLSWAGADKNGKTVTLAETGSTFTTAGPFTFAGGVDADAASSDDMESFAANSNAGTIWAFWDDLNSAGRHVALKQGDTSLAANSGRKFFYAWKDANGATKTSVPIPVLGLKYDTKLYNAGQVQISKIKYGGTVSATQTIHLRITETTPTQLPYPTYNYEQVFDTDIATTCTALAAKVTAEFSKNDPIATATASSDTLTITGTSKYRTFKLSGFLETTATAATDALTLTFPTSGTQAAVPPVGDTAFVAEMAKYANIYQGGINYAPEGTNVDEFQDGTGSNASATTTWDVLMVKSTRTETGQTNVHSAKAHVVVIVPSGSAAALAAL